MQIKTYLSDESESLIQKEKFSSFAEMLRQGWKMNHPNINDHLSSTDSDEIINIGIVNDNLNEAQTSEENCQN